MAIRIFIDQGHNPTGTFNTGAQGFGLFEENITYQVGIYLADLLRSDGRFEVRVSRPTPYTVLGTDVSSSLAERVRLANEWPAHYFISIHANANVNPNINGSEAYIYRHYSQAEWLAQNIIIELTRYTGLEDNGIRANPTLYVLRNTRMPAVLVEMGYLTNPQDAEILRDNQYQIAYGIYLGILDYFGFTPR